MPQLQWFTLGLLIYCTYFIAIYLLQTLTIILYCAWHQGLTIYKQPLNSSYTYIVWVLLFIFQKKMLSVAKYILIYRQITYYTLGVNVRRSCFNSAFPKVWFCSESYYDNFLNFLFFSLLTSQTGFLTFRHISVNLFLKIRQKSNESVIYFSYKFYKNFKLIFL